MKARFYSPHLGKGQVGDFNFNNCQGSNPWFLDVDGASQWIKNVHIKKFLQMLAFLTLSQKHRRGRPDISAEADNLRACLSKRLTRRPTKQQTPKSSWKPKSAQGAATDTGERARTINRSGRTELLRVAAGSKGSWTRILTTIENL